MKRSTSILLRAMALPAAVFAFGAPAFIFAEEMEPVPAVEENPVVVDAANTEIVAAEEPAAAAEQLVSAEESSVPAVVSEAAPAETPELAAQNEEEVKGSAPVVIEKEVEVSGEGDQFLILNEAPAKDFTFEADVEFDGGEQSAALVFGVKDQENPGQSWNAANVHKANEAEPARVFGVEDGLNVYATASQSDIDIDWMEKLHLALDVKSDGTFTYQFGNAAKDASSWTTMTGKITDWVGGYVGLLSYNSSTMFSNIQFANREANEGLFVSPAEKAELVNGVLQVEQDGNNFVTFKEEGKVNAFIVEADVVFPEQDALFRCAGISFGMQGTNEGAEWSAANIDTARVANADYLRLFGPSIGGDTPAGVAGLDNLDWSQPFHLKLEVQADGSYIYSFGNITGPSFSAEGKCASWNGGYAGVMTWDSKAEFYNVVIQNLSVEKELDQVEINEDYHTNLENLHSLGGTWTVDESGLTGNNVGKGDSFIFTDVSGANFVYTTELKFNEDSGAAGLIFRNQSTTDKDNAYAVNVDRNGNAKLWRWDSSIDQQLVAGAKAEASDTYTLKVIAVNGLMSYYINDVLVANVGDYTFGSQDLGQSTIPADGCFGLINWNGNVTFQNTYFKELSAEEVPSVTNIQVVPVNGSIEKPSAFYDDAIVMTQLVENAVDSVKLDVSVLNGAEVYILDADAVVYSMEDVLPLEKGNNYFTVLSIKDDVTFTYRVNVRRMAEDEQYYNEAYRDQFHYSVKDGWANDPNGMVYYNGTYHLFYQYYTGTQWGPMHWMHATSTDLIHWTEEAVALAPDVNGTMFSGCAIAVENNDTGLFASDAGGLMAFVTMNGNGQRIKIMTSDDEGKTWNKVNEIAADWIDDPLMNRDFRDPKVFQWEDTWFMVVAGGPLRIYSSSDLLNWQAESVYGDLHTECPDLYPIQADDGEIKWVLDRGGRYYKVGDFKQVDGKWTFVPDEAYSGNGTQNDGIMNFGKDSYAAMTFYVNSFGSADDFQNVDIIAINWMNTWDNYCNQVADTVGQEFNGTFNLLLKNGLVKAGDTYVLTQTPIAEYESLRQEAAVDQTGILVGGTNADPLADFEGDTYEIVAKFHPEEGTTKVGFELRSNGSDQKTLVVYDIENNKVYIDRSQSGIQISNMFSQVDSQDLSKLDAVKNEDGSIDLHIYVDKASVEVFTDGDTVTGANQIFPDPTSLKAAVLVEGTACTLDLAVYELDSIWTDKVELEKPTELLVTTGTDLTVYVGDTVQLRASVLPVQFDQSMVWSVEEGEDVIQVDENGLLSASSKGTARILVASKDYPELFAEILVKVCVDNFNTNVEGLTNMGGNWTIDDEILHEDNVSSNDFYMSSESYDGSLDLSVDVAYENGLVNIFFAADGQNPFTNQAYAVQLTQGRELKIFRFAGDTILTTELDAPINDGAMHNVRILRDGTTVTVEVDGVVVCETEMEDAEEFFFDGNVGLGLWDGSVDFKNFIVNPVASHTDGRYGSIQNAIDTLSETHVIDVHRMPQEETLENLPETGLIFVLNPAVDFDTFKERMIIPEGWHLEKATIAVRTARTVSDTDEYTYVSLHKADGYELDEWYREPSQEQTGLKQILCSICGKEMGFNEYALDPETPGEETTDQETTTKPDKTPEASTVGTRKPGAVIQTPVTPAAASTGVETGFGLTLTSLFTSGGAAALLAGLKKKKRRHDR